MAIKTVLFHTQFREMAFNALKSIIELKAAGLRKVILAHVIPREEVGFVPYGGTLKDDLKRMREEARIKFEDWVQTIDDPQLEFSQRIEVGATIAEIFDMVEEEKADLIVVGRKKRTVIEKVYVGTHILDILRRSKVPVLMSKYMVQYESQGESLTRTNEAIWKRPLLASDWSDPSRRALEATMGLKGLVEKIIVTHRRPSRALKPKAKNGCAPIASRSRMPAYPVKPIWLWATRLKRLSRCREITLPPWSSWAAPAKTGSMSIGWAVFPIGWPN